MNFLNQNKTKYWAGFSLVEILVAISLFVIGIGSVAFFSLDTLRATKNMRQRIRATEMVHEVESALAVIKADSWREIIDNADGSDKHIVFASNMFSIEDGAATEGDFTVTMQISSAQRDGTGNLIESGGTEDIHTKRVEVQVSWVDIIGNNQERTAYFYINDWNTRALTDTLAIEFNQGVHDLTTTTENGDGEVELETIIYADWCNPNWTMSWYDIPRQGETGGISAYDATCAVMGTGANQSGISFTRVNIDESDPPVVSVAGEFDGYKTNDVFMLPGYALIATDTNSSEVVIIQTSTLPYSLAGYFDAPGSQDANTVSATDEFGITAISNKVYTFDLTSKNGSRPSLDSVTVAGTVKEIKIKGDYAYVVTSSATTQLQVLNVTNPSDISIVGQAQLTAAGGVDVFVNPDETRAYLATAGSTSYPEVFLLDISTKETTYPTIGTYDTNGMDPYGIVEVPDMRAIVVGHLGEEYQVINTEEETSLTRCGGLEYSAGINGVTTVTNPVGDAYSYLLTADSTQEFIIIRGGPGGSGGANGYGYSLNGSFISRVFDTLVDDPLFYYISWGENVPSGTDLRMQVRSSDSNDMSGATWMGPDGTSGTYFTVNDGETLPLSLSNKRYFQYRIVFLSDTVSTPILEDLSVTYQQ